MANTLSSDDDNHIDDTDYMLDAEQLIGNHNQITIENALILNKKMQAYFMNLSDEVERLLIECQQKHKKNEKLLEELSITKSPLLASSTYYFCGYPYFKDRHGYGAPQPAEYLERRDKNHELFPIDLITKKTYWVPRDKFNLIQGVKKQTIDFLQSKNRDKIRQSTSKRCADGITARLKAENEAIKEMQLVDLLKKTEGTDFQINWLQISLTDLGDRHTINECIAMWQSYLNPSVNRREWTPDEEKKLLAATQEFEMQDWEEIAKNVPNRSAFQCFVHYRTVFNDHVIQRTPFSRWTPNEDQQLIQTVEKYRIGNVIPWTKIMEKMHGRTKGQLYNRYMFTLHPQINRNPFNVEEDCILMAAIKEYGTNFRKFPPNLLPGRNMKQIRSRYNNVLKFVKVRGHWTEDHDGRLMKLVEKYGTTDWAKISEELVVHNRTSCRQRYTTIKKFLDKNPGSTVADVPRRKRAFSSKVTTDNWMETIIKSKRDELMGSDLESDADSEHFIDDRRLHPNSKYFKAKTLGGNAFELFKYSYNFKLGYRMPSTDNLFENIQITCQLLQAPSIPHQIDITNESFSDFVTAMDTSKKIPLESDLLAPLAYLGKNGFNFPVNYNTVLGLRGLVAMFESKLKNRQKSKSKPKPKPITFDQHDALDLFKARFKSIFQNTAAAAKLVDLDKSITSVMVKRPNRKRKRTTDFDNNATMVSVVPMPSTSSSCQMSSTDPTRRITVLESITLDLGTSSHESQPSTSQQSPELHYSNLEKPGSSPIYKIHIQSADNTQSEPEDLSYTNFIIWSPTAVGDDHREMSPSKKFQENDSKSM